MRLVLSLGAITVVLAAQIAANAKPPGEGGGPKGTGGQGQNVQAPIPQGQGVQTHNPQGRNVQGQTFQGHNPPPNREVENFQNKKGEHWPSDWHWRWYPGRGWYAPDGRYLVARPILDPIRIINPASNTATLNYTLNGFPYTIPPGHSQELNDDRPWVIEFPRGNGLGIGRYSLQPGRYHFTNTPNGWELYWTEAVIAAPPAPPSPSLGQGGQPPALPQPTDPGATTPASSAPEPPAESTPTDSATSGPTPPK